ncbi:MAG: exosortase T [Sinimarinibacterium flocculans]|uniref:exosortase T n=1 Tax=Sinimarinibacterium flocculans TaxID=985250 RepID=UPI003C38CDBE
MVAAMRAGVGVDRIGPAPVLLVAALLLAIEPAGWLLRSWRDAAYNPQGLWIGLAVAALFLWSWASEQQPGSAQNRRYAFALLAVSALVRLVGQVLRVNVIGALTLALDVYALATLAGLRTRERAVSPFWLSLLFAFSLPLERVVQRLAGYGLQQLSASGACEVLGWFTDGLLCVGTRLLLDGQDLLVDLPCSGARGLMLVLTLYAGLCALRRPRPAQALVGLLFTLAGAWLSNTLRIVALAIGLVQAPQLDLMNGPAHEALGLCALLLAAVPVLLWARRITPFSSPARERVFAGAGAGAARGDREPRSAPLDPDAAAPTIGSANPASARARPWAWLLLGFAIVAVSAPARPVDVVRDTPPPQAPVVLGAYAAQPQALDAVEREYFARYGGGAAKASYGPFGLLLVSTRAPLRHLHAPDECLRGSGYRVDYLGLEHAGLPSALYRATDAGGRSWRVAVSYVSDRGEHAASVGEAVWRWLRAPEATWTMVQRIAPWPGAEDPERRDWESALLRALDLPSAPVHLVHRVPDAI